MAILKLKKEDSLDLNIYTPACMARFEDSNRYAGKIATAAGWGNIKTKPEVLPKVPYHVKFKVKHQSNCTKINSNKPEHPADLCTFWPGGGQNTCNVSIELLDCILL